MKHVKIASSVLIAGLVLSLSGCGVEDDAQESLYPEKPTLSVSNLEVVNGGSQLVWHLSVNNKHSSTTIKIGPWNDTTYYFSSLGESYSDSVELACNTEVQGAYAECNKVDEIVCDRVGIGSDYSEYRCDYKIDGALYPQYQEKMRVATLSNQPTPEEVLLSVGTEYWYESNGYEQSGYVFETDTAKMFNVYSGDVGP